MDKPVKKYKRKTFSKLWTERILWISMIDIQLCFVLCFLNKIQVAEQLAIAIVTQVIGVFIAYSAKAFFETREEERIKLERDKIEPLG